MKYAFAKEPEHPAECGLSFGLDYSILFSAAKTIRLSMHWWANIWYAFAVLSGIAVSIAHKNQKSTLFNLYWALQRQSGNCVPIPKRNVVDRHFGRPNGRHYLLCIINCNLRNKLRSNYSNNMGTVAICNIVERRLVDSLWFGWTGCLKTCRYIL